MFVVAIYIDNDVLAGFTLLAIILYAFYRIVRFIISLFSKGKTGISPICIEYLGTDVDMPDDYNTYIAGANYRCSNRDIGGFIGFAIPQSDNKHDKNAVAIYNKGGRHLGFIPKAEAKGFREWCDTRVVPCVGYILKENGKFRGRVKALLPENKKAVDRATAYYIRWMVKTFGLKFVPSDFAVQKMKTDEETIDAINEYIDRI